MAKKIIKNSNRSEKIAGVVQTHVAEILRDKFSDDPILSGINLVGSESRGGLQFVRLFYYAHGLNSSSVNALQQRLDSITSMVRYELAQRMNQKYVPDIKFTYDDTLDKAARIEELLK